MYSRTRSRKASVSAKRAIYRSISKRQLVLASLNAPSNWPAEVIQNCRIAKDRCPECHCGGFWHWDELTWECSYCHSRTTTPIKTRKKVNDARSEETKKDPLSLCGPMTIKESRFASSDIEDRLIALVDLRDLDDELS